MNEDDAARQLRDAVDARMASVPDDDGDSLDAIRGRLRTPRSSRVPVFIAIAAAAAVLIGAAIALTRDDGKTRVVVPAGSSSSSEPMPRPATDQVAIPLWPLPGKPLFTSPEDAAVSFARDYLGFGNPVAHQNSDGLVNVTPNGDAGPVTRIHVVTVASGWVVTGAASDTVALSHADETADGTEVTGSSVAFEAQLVVQLRRFGSVTPFASTTAMGGSTELAPFDATIPAVGPGVVVAYAPDASGRGTAIAASVRAVGSPPFDTASFDGTIIARVPDGSFVTVTSAAGVPSTADALSARRAPAVDQDFDLLGSHATLCGPTAVAVVDSDGKTVKRIDFIDGVSNTLFTAQHTITSLDANVLGGLIFTDSESGLWRWDGPGQGPVQMATGYVDAAW